MTATAAPTTNCLRCGRVLTSAKSIAAGYGRGCARKIRANVEGLDARFTAKQIEDAIELIEDGGAIPVDGVAWLTVGSRGGVEIYTTTAHSCSCKAGRNGLACYHVAGVLMLGGAARYVTAA